MTTSLPRTGSHVAAVLSDAVVDDADAGVYRTNRRIFTDEEIFELEMKHIFEGNWIYLAHDSRVRSRWRDSRETCVARSVWAGHASTVSSSIAAENRMTATLTLRCPGLPHCHRRHSDELIRHLGLYPEGKDTPAALRRRTDAARWRTTGAASGNSRRRVWRRSSQLAR